MGFTKSLISINRHGVTVKQKKSVQLFDKATDTPTFYYLRG
jgi:hypothetical protein